MEEPSDWNHSLVLELRRLAGVALASERRDHTLQPTALVNEAYLVLQRQRNLEDASRSTFLAAAAKTIRRILVDHARKRNSLKRGGGQARVALSMVAAESTNQIDVLVLNDALEALAVQSSRAADIVEMRFFGGMTNEEVAENLGVSLRTVLNDWKFSKAWLYRKMAESRSEEL